MLNVNTNKNDLLKRKEESERERDRYLKITLKIPNNMYSRLFIC